MRLGGHVRRRLLFVWTDSRFVERAVEWIKKSGFVTVEVLIQPFFDRDSLSLIMKSYDTNEVSIPLMFLRRMQL